jgi:hypothetical protein
MFDWFKFNLDDIFAVLIAAGLFVQVIALVCIACVIFPQKLVLLGLALSVAAIFIIYAGIRP